MAKDAVCVGMCSVGSAVARCSVNADWVLLIIGDAGSVFLLSLPTVLSVLRWSLQSSAVTVDLRISPFSSISLYFTGVSVLEQRVPRPRLGHVTLHRGQGPHQGSGSVLPQDAAQGQRHRIWTLGAVVGTTPAGLSTGEHGATVRPGGGRTAGHTPGLVLVATFP